MLLLDVFAEIIILMNPFTGRDFDRAGRRFPLPPG